MVTLLKAILGLGFYVVLTPLAIVLRIFKVDLIERRMDSGADSYWRNSRSGSVDFNEKGTSDSHTTRKAQPACDSAYPIQPDQ